MPRPANPRRRRGASGHPQAPRACADSRPRGASGDIGPRDGNNRFSEAYRDAGLVGGASALSLTEAEKAGWARLPGRRGGRTDRCAGRGSRYRSRSAMASASSNRSLKRMHKTGFGLGQPATLGLRLSRFRGFPLSGDLPTRGMAFRGCTPADADAHGRRPSGGTFRRFRRGCCSQC